MVNPVGRDADYCFIAIGEVTWPIYNGSQLGFKLLDVPEVMLTDKDKTIH